MMSQKNVIELQLHVILQVVDMQMLQLHPQTKLQTA